MSRGRHSYPWRSAAALIVALVAGLAVSCGGAPRPAAAPLDRPAPAFTLGDHTGRTYALSEYAGRKVLLVFYMGYF